jgi:PEP-CTERM motif
MLRSCCLVATCVLAVTVGTANADTFDVSGSGTIPMDGMLTIDPSTGAVGPEDVTVPNPPNTTGLDFTNLTSSMLGSGSTWDITLNQGATGFSLLLILPETTLVGYAGGTIEEVDLYQTATGPEGGLLCTSGDCGALTASASTPVPEPSTWAMMPLGFAFLGYARYRRTRSSGVRTRATV